MEPCVVLEEDTLEMYLSYRYLGAVCSVSLDTSESYTDIQRSAKRLVRGCEKLVPALVYLFCLPLPWSCLTRFAYLLADLCIL